MGNQQDFLMIGKEQRQVDEEIKRKNGEEAQTQQVERQSEVYQVYGSQEEMILDKEFQEVAKINHKVDVIKMLKDRKGIQVEEVQQIQKELQQDEIKVEAIEEPPHLKVQQKSVNKRKILTEESKYQQSKQQQLPLVQKQQYSIEQKKEMKVSEAPKFKQFISESVSEPYSDSDFNQQFSKQQQELPKTITFTKFSSSLKSSTIQLLQGSPSFAVQKSQYYQNQKLILTQPITAHSANASFRVQNLKYCVGVGLALKEVIQQHSFNYKSYANELAHGLYIVTSQGYSWSHHLKDQDDILHQGFNRMKNDDIIKVTFENGHLSFSLKEFSFQLQIPSLIVDKYTLCLCAYLHQKDDSMSLSEEK